MEKIRREEGQSVIMVAFVLVVLIALVALVVDVGNAYAQRRVVQNAADAAALAATRELARGVQVTTNRLVLSKAKEYAQMNGVDPNTVTARYFRFNPDTRTMTDLGAVPNTSTRPPSNADGVMVDAGKTFNTYLARVVGRNFLAASARSWGQVSKGACVAGAGSGLFPIAVNVALFDNDQDNGKPTPGKTYTIWDKSNSGTIPPGNFGWVHWRNQNSSNSVLVDNMNDTSRSGVWAIGDTLPGATGVMSSSGVRNALDVRIANSDPTRPAQVLLPIFDTSAGTGSNATYHIIGFGWFVLTAYNSQGNDKWIQGYFVEDAVPVAEGGCMDFGTKTVKLRPPMELTRNIAGNIAFEYLRVTKPTGQTTYPVDVVNVIDVSGSMNDRWGSPAVAKVSTARDVLVQFNNMLRPDIGDQVGLVKFPVRLSDNPTQYTPACAGKRVCGMNGTSTCTSGKTKQRHGAQIVKNLTSNIASVNTAIRNLTADGWTPTAAAMQKGLEAVLDPLYHQPNNIPIIVLASDGMNNILLDGRMTYWDGRYAVEPSCNVQASADSIDVANQAKAAGVTLFTVAVGDDFLTYVMQAMATPDTNPAYPHFLQASSPDAMAQIYQALGDRIVNFGGECTVRTEDQPANGALVRLYKDGAQVAQTYADAAGNFTFDNVQPGTYTFSATITRDGVTYDVFTNKVGGVTLSSPPTLVVGESAGTYSITLSLKTARPPQCGL